MIGEGDEMGGEGEGIGACSLHLVALNAACAPALSLPESTGACSQR